MQKDSFLLIFLVLSTLFVVAIPAVVLSARGDYSAWTYSKVLQVTNTTALPAGYQLNFTVHAGVGADSANNIYLNGHGSFNDFRDLRFVDGDRNLLDMWNQTIVNGNYVKVWVETNVLPYITMYYGNPYASEIWSDAAVFERIVTGAVLALPMNENTGTTVYDYSSGENDGAINGGSWVSTGKFSTAVNLDGSDDWISLSAAGLANINNAPLSVAVWIQPSTTITANGYVIFKGTDTAATSQYAIYYNYANEMIDVYLEGVANASSVVGSVIKNGSSTLVGFTWNGTHVQAYTNDVASGVLGSLTGSLTTKNNFGIGKRFTAAFFKGLVSNVYLFNVTLSSSDWLAFKNYYPQVFDNHLGGVYLRHWASGSVSVGTVGSELIDGSVTEQTTEQDVNWMAFVVLIVFSVLNIFLILVPRVYVLNFVVAALTLAFAAATVNDATLPIQPYFSLIVALLSVLGILRAAQLLRNG